MELQFKSELTISESGFLFDHATGLTYTLNSTGQFIFRNIQDKQNARSILSLVMNEFEVNEDTAHKDLDDFIRQLKEFNLVGE
ncbi:MAG: PqqD family protein [Candidatus Marinimicrobia bacterium]|jgi:hypothetical protein|nr:PqqD family protein [Candidatus Neomarinimicrobiota bacterium]MBT3840045.1 PqqD family protein [Candidatus Neomarinimicrobiota bacterium]MBT4000077.1 PqqD family protein [Candidatus Neomarinimicrobiota bacterium]MBT4282124.1 PqqD family protein [Candidatus Neomarinimicrobiota bacterium]MBT4578863.1 PqqD family protein [Candidatus Neomarinimicrobiota bacterium]